MFPLIALKLIVMQFQNLNLRQFLLTSILLLTGSLLTSALDMNQMNNEISFDKDYVGVVFSPYVKNKEGSFIPAYNSYSKKDIWTMLKLVATKFRNISTYGVGATGNDSTWETGNSVGLTGVEAAQLNKQLKSTVISVSLGVWQHSLVPYVNNAIKTAFDITETANKLHRGTVWGITLTSNYIESFGPNDRVDQVMKMLEIGKHTSNFRNIPIKFGIRLGICELILGYGNKDNLLRILNSFDYLICFKNPQNEAARTGVHSAVKNMADAMKAIISEVKNINPKLEVIFETGWPSAGISKESLNTSTAALKEFWREISIWAASNKIPVYLFAAFDEPWKSMANKELNSHEGLCGAESHFGWWRLVDNNDMTSYVEKINEPENPVCERLKGLRMSTGAKVGIAIGLIVFIGSLSTIIFLYIKLRKAKADKLTDDEIAEFEEGINLTEEESENLEVALRLPYDRKYELDKDKFQIDKHVVLGSGEFGIVYRGKIIGSIEDVAFKTAKPRCPVENLKSLLSEIKLMIYIGHHENIVGLVAAYTGDLRNGEVFIASEFCSNGSLEKFLRSSSKEKYVNVKFEMETESSKLINEDESKVNSSSSSIITLSMKNLVNWSYQIAHGMDYLASKNVIHADLAARNVLLTASGIAKITDFGLSRKLYSYTNYVKKKQEPLPWRWMSIEALRQLSFSTQSDVWSYGVTLWEIFSLGDVPYPGLGWDIDFVDKLNKGLRLQQPMDASPEIYAEMYKCWDKNPGERPTFRELANYFLMLTKKLDAINYEVLE